MWGLVACGTSPAPTPFPTLTFVPPTITPVPISPSPLPTAVNALDFMTPQALPPVPDTHPEIDSSLLTKMLDDAAKFWALESNQVQVLGIKASVWQKFDCRELRVDLISDLDFVPEGITGYRVIVGTGEDALVYLGKTDGEFLRCPDAHRLDSNGQALFADPLVVELVELAQHDLARRQNADRRDIRAVDVVAVTWRDTSLGCPIAEQIYPAQMIPGYRILLKYRADYYPYHTDFLAPIYCANEVMPPPFKATPNN